MNDLKGRIALVTGARLGIGREMALGLDIAVSYLGQNDEAMDINNRSAHRDRIRVDRCDGIQSHK